MGPLVPLTLALALTAQFMPSADAAYVYPSTCPNACYYASLYSPANYQLCMTNCNNCLWYWGWNCYSAFNAIYSGNFYVGFQCWCYWPWWAWFLLAIGISLIFGCCVFAAMKFMRRS